MPPLANQLNYIDPTEYLAGERDSEIKHEYLQGQVFAMAGASINHNRIVRNFSSLLWNEMQDQSSEPVTSDMLLKTADDKYRYPDLMVICENDDSSDNYVRENPVLVVEVSILTITELSHDQAIFNYRNRSSRSFVVCSG